MQTRGSCTASSNKMSLSRARLAQCPGSRLSSLPPASACQLLGPLPHPPLRGIPGSPQLPCSHTMMLRRDMLLSSSRFCFQGDKTVSNSQNSAPSPSEPIPPRDQSLYSPWTVPQILKAFGTKNRTHA